jgi:outer membrane receptor protein involved in Fe transport
MIPAMSRLRDLGWLLRLAGAVVCAVALDAGSVYGQSGRIEGQVVDIGGAPIQDARVTLTVGAQTLEVRTGPDGRFQFESAPAGSGRVIVAADGFQSASVDIAIVLNGPMKLPTLALQPAPLTEHVTVSVRSDRGGLDTPASVSVITAAEIMTTPAGAVDDLLRITPGFSLFRRTSSRTANPTAQGVTLRGLSASGASRTLVLVDGLTLNDPFGGWVYWNRIPVAAIERIETVRGGIGDLYGPDAVGGVVQMLTASPTRTRLRAIFEGGQRSTLRGSLFGSVARGAWHALAAGETHITDGAYVVSASDRGAADVPAGSDYGTALLGLGYDRDASRFRLRANFYGEDRENGVDHQVNDTNARQFAGEAEGQALGGIWRMRGFGGSQGYDQTFSAIAPDRSSDVLNREQRVATTFGGGEAEWVGRRRGLDWILGWDYRRVDADTSETRYIAGVPIAPVDDGGRIWSSAAFVHLTATPVHSVTLQAGLRADVWDLASPFRTSGQHRWFASPRVAATWRVAPSAAVRAAFSRANRTPTLNELYRGFQVGTVVTRPNDLLTPESLTAFEGGVLLSGANTALRATFFFNDLDDVITNLTLLSTPQMTTRQRTNAGTIRASGVEWEGEWRPLQSMVVSGAAVYTHARFRGGEPTIEGLEPPQTPRWSGAVAIRWTSAVWGAVQGQVRAIGDQFEDDRNTLVLNATAIVDVSASRPLQPTLHVFGAIENLFDVEYDTGRTPLRTIGWPRTARAGMRWFLP